MEIKIRRGPLPDYYKSARERLPFASLEVGGSFFVDRAQVAPQTVRTEAHRYAKKNGGKFSVQVADGGVNVFRIE